MLYDLNQGGVGEALSGQRFDVCIAGAGVAGITAALKLSEKGRSVLLLEGGGLKSSSESQELYRGRNLGMEYFDLRACRLRYLGGTSNHWAGWCRPLDAFDFEPKDHIPNSGWPIEKADLLPYEESAYEILDIEHAPRADEEFADSKGLLKWFEMVFSRPTKFGLKYRKDLEKSENIHLILNANLVDLRLNHAQTRVSEVVCRSHESITVDHSFAADSFILALGGIENARTLLNADSQLPGGIGNQNDLVGRFFCEHPHANLGHYWLRNEQHERRRFLAPTRDLVIREKIGVCGLRLTGVGRWPVDDFDLASTGNAAKNLICDFQGLEEILGSVGPDCESVGLLSAAWEQTPNPDSRVLLSEERDKFGLRLSNLDWQWTPMERRTARVCALEVGKALARGDTGRLKISDWVLDESLPVPGLSEGSPLAGNHHMGTTRMSTDPGSGVVDKNCLVFGTDNLYIAGSSVFPTVGHANPTFTIVQLTLRLADHIGGEA